MRRAPPHGAARRSARLLARLFVPARVLALVFVLASCAAPPPPPVVIVAPPVPPPAPLPIPEPAPPPLPDPAELVAAEDAKQVAETLAFYAKVAGLSPDDQRREFAAAAQAYNRDRSMVNRVRFAMLLALPGASFQDDARAAALLEPNAPQSAGAPAMRQLAMMLHAQVIDRLRAQKRADQLKEQLDALRALERSLIERGQPARRTPK